MKKKGTYIGFVMLIIALIFLYGFTSDKNKEKRLIGTMVEFGSGDNNFLTHSMVKKMLIQNNDFIKNQPKRVIDLHVLETSVSSNPYVEKSTVFLTIDGVLKTVVKQRKPLIRVVNKKSSFYVDEYGVKIPLSASFSARVPLVSGVNTSVEIKEVIKLIKVILSDDFLTKEIVAIKRSTLGEYMFNVRSGNYKINFGSYKDVAIKFKKLKAFYNKAFVDKTIKKYKVINLKYQNQVVCTK